MRDAAPFPGRPSWKISWRPRANLKTPTRDHSLGCALVVVVVVVLALCFIQSLYHLHALTQNSCFYFLFSSSAFAFAPSFFLNKSLRFSFSQIYVFLLAFAELLSEVFCAASWHTQKVLKKKQKKKQKTKHRRGKKVVRKGWEQVENGKARRPQNMLSSIDAPFDPNSDFDTETETETETDAEA